tara:strand:+ start:387 stop:542 length:156 start_codon:yes stop_codon:yes gene_type:complete
LKIDAVSGNLDYRIYRNPKDTLIVESNQEVIIKVTAQTFSLLSSVGRAEDS